MYVGLEEDDVIIKNINFLCWLVIWVGYFFCLRLFILWLFKKKIFIKIWFFGCEVNFIDILVILEEIEFSWNWKIFLIIFLKVVEVLFKNLLFIKKLFF